MELNNTDALVRLLVGERSTITAYARSIVFDRHLADDVYQNVCVVLLRKPDEAREAKEPLKWILGVTRLEALVALRRKGPSAQVFDESLLDLLDEKWMNRIAAQEENSARANKLRQCLTKLTERSRRVLRLRYAEELTGEALAEKLGVQLNTAYVSLSRIHRELRSCVERRQAQS